MKSEVLEAVILKIKVFWDVMAHSLGETYQQSHPNKQ